MSVRRESALQRHRECQFPAKLDTGGKPVLLDIQQNPQSSRALHFKQRMGMRIRIVCLLKCAFVVAPVSHTCGGCCCGRACTFQVPGCFRVPALSGCCSWQTEPRNESFRGLWTESIRLCMDCQGQCQLGTWDNTVCDQGYDQAPARGQSGTLDLSRLHDHLARGIMPLTEAILCESRSHNRGDNRLLAGQAVDCVVCHEHSCLSGHASRLWAGSTTFEVLLAACEHFR